MSAFVKSFLGTVHTPNSVMIKQFSKCGPCHGASPYALGLGNGISIASPGTCLTSPPGAVLLRRSEALRLYQTADNDFPLIIYFRAKTILIIIEEFLRVEDVDPETNDPNSDKVRAGMEKNGPRVSAGTLADGRTSG